MRFSVLFFLPFLLQTAQAAINYTTVTTSIAEPSNSDVCNTYETAGGRGTDAWYARVQFIADSTNDIAILGTGVRSYKYLVQWYFTYAVPLEATDFDVSFLTGATGLLTTVDVIVNPQQGAFIFSYNSTVTYPIALGVDLLNGLNCFNTLIGYNLKFSGGDFDRTVIMGSSLFWLNPINGLSCTINSIGKPGCVALGYPALSNCITWGDCSIDSPPPVLTIVTLTATQSDGCTVYQQVLQSGYSYTTQLVSSSTYTLTVTTTWRSATKTGLLGGKDYTTFTSTYTSTGIQTITLPSLVISPVNSLITATTACPSSSDDPSSSISPSSSDTSNSSASVSISSNYSDTASVVTSSSDPVSAASSSSDPASVVASSSDPESAASSSSDPASVVTSSSDPVSTASSSSDPASIVVSSSDPESTASSSSDPASVVVSSSDPISAVSSSSDPESTASSSSDPASVVASSSDPESTASSSSDPASVSSSSDPESTASSSSDPASVVASSSDPISAASSSSDSASVVVSSSDPESTVSSSSDPESTASSSSDPAAVASSSDPASAASSSSDPVSTTSSSSNPASTSSSSDPASVAPSSSLTSSPVSESSSVTPSFTPVPSITDNSSSQGASSIKTVWVTDTTWVNVC
ncbi:hypothetical protein BABINDRAFT_10186 [Babjeviella inositovora NRRL Y-12698]|uniref:Flo11 domain-containing protein n=1 Tax=Babjeviella inositovora NRRL Y-12698 TaxID=984486 RepID=A0A1E3QHU7_9ASCO|nr:uncharacterized protein BABINDRAFT_10186 [Babjeviella inositovora NRRL Y-12698]ODQ77275.1 hypothetical protein BABINDRAFT_10186 [Babjeviella inositovora NRRL Y-12698]